MENRILKRAGRLGATHIYSAGATTVARDKDNIKTSANAYRCSEALKQMD
ncbi:MAG: hypothetical protein R2827_15880 [Bdellovibrionales bacterium]